jgi:hypothetical protein
VDAGVNTTMPPVNQLLQREKLDPLKAEPLKTDAAKTSATPQ